MTPLALAAALALAAWSAAQEGPEEARGTIDDIRIQGGAELRISQGLRGPVDAKALFYDAPRGGRLLWTSPPFRLHAEGGSVRVDRIPAMPFHMDASIPAKNRLFLEFRVASEPVLPRLWARKGLVPRYRTGRRIQSRSYTLYLKLSPAQEDAEEPRRVPLIAPPPKAAPAAPPPKAQAARPAAKAAPKAKRLAAKPGPAREPGEEEIRLSNDLYFRALRDYARNPKDNYTLAMAELFYARTLNPKNQEIEAAMERMRLETRSPLPREATTTKVLPSLEAMQEANDLYFTALRQYGHGELRQARATLLQAAGLDPSNEGVANAVERVQRELAAIPDVH